MRLLFVNPNITESITDVMMEEAKRSIAPATTLVPATARFGTLYIENSVEAAIAAHAVLEAIAEKVDGCDAVIVAAFGDPGVRAAKEMVDVPVVGVSEAAYLTAWTLGRRYSVVCMTPRHRVWYRECAEEHGLDGRLASVRPLPVTVTDVTKARDQFRELLIAECLKAVEEDGAEVIVLGGGPLAGLARTFRDSVPVPVLDPVECAVRLAEMLAGINAKPPQRGSFARPAPKPSKGLSEALERRFSVPRVTPPAE
jgi:allantoin racemase